MNDSVIIRVLKKVDENKIVQARENVKVSHDIVFEGETAGCTVDPSAFGEDDKFYPGAYVIVGAKRG